MIKQIVVLVAVAVAVYCDDDQPEYIKQCRESDPALLDCLKDSLHHLRPYLAAGIPEIEMPPVEPFRMDKLSLALTEFQHKRPLSENGKPFQARVTMPRLRIASKYLSSGVLIILPASGNGTFSGTFDGVTADLSGTVSTSERNGLKYLHVDSLHLDLKVRDVRMQVSRVFNNNRILTEATNLFLRENGQEVLGAMSPQLRKKLSAEFSRIANQLLLHVPISKFLLP
ncbi:uncharacterized protein LOC113370284 [Ctenocephalides felis]|uniref:uncharacterized protein LOC113370284 n=1 Tax=Ctenocephalides felis TaxID=7515 RepID=UPI000E6E2880|nr:uncharacterized protein LOC113370284 [Ctenocephalides felis]